MKSENTMMKRITLIFLPMLLLPLQVAHGAVTSDPLGTFFDGLKTLQADFQQQVVNESGKVLQQASGTLWIQRPGKFRWDYQLPYRQLVLADGRQLWNYDEDLEQAVVKNVDEILPSTPAMLLSGDRPITDVFMVTHLGEESGYHWVELLPRAKETSFDRIRLGFAGDTLVKMEMRDPFNQVTKLEFSHVRRNQILAPELFVFTPKPGVDVIGK